MCGKIVDVVYAGHFQDQRSGIRIICYCHGINEFRSLYSSYVTAFKKCFDDYGSGTLEEATDLWDNAFDGFFEVFFAQSIQNLDNDVGGDFISSKRCDSIFEDGAVDLFEQLSGGERAYCFEKTSADLVIQDPVYEN